VTEKFGMLHVRQPAGHAVVMDVNSLSMRALVDVDKEGILPSHSPLTLSWKKVPCNWVLDLSQTPVLASYPTQFPNRFALSRSPSSVSLIIAKRFYKSDLTVDSSTSDNPQLLAPSRFDKQANTCSTGNQVAQHTM
jgi:hypothetical protein